MLRCPDNWFSTYYGSDVLASVTSSDGYHPGYRFPGDCLNDCQIQILISLDFTPMLRQITAREEGAIVSDDRVREGGVL